MSKVTQAKFLGKDGSLGYRTGQVYTLEISIDRDYIWVRSWGHNACPYSNMKALNKNWDFMIFENFKKI